jgi:cinnamyl-alcohol dehydrogenase
VQSASVDGPDGNCLGWAARDSSGVLSPYKFSRRQLQPNDVMIKITHAGGFPHDTLSHLKA